LEGILYVFLPGGEVILGADTEELSHATENPQHGVEVGAFWMRQSEVTNAQYQLCVTQGGCTHPTNPSWQDAALADHPVTNVSWEQANAYARWAGGRLPTEAEWEYGCQGPTEQEYPWGDAEPAAELSNFGDDVGGTAAVGSHPDGVSPFGLLDMSGNVWEWTSSLDRLYPYDAEDGREDLDASGLRIGRGGSFGFSQEYLRCSTRVGFHPDWQIPHLGLRVVIEEAD
jgi:formylglycine-generating enzyme required for sulfatase activity